MSVSGDIMILLAMDSSAVVASAALVSDERTIAEFTVNNKKNHSESLLPLVDTVLKFAGMEISEVDGIAVSTGPGSFTGLRIGGATAKALAHGAGKKLISVPTLDALAYNISGEAGIIVPIMDARRNQVYSCFYEYRSGVPVRLCDYMAEDINKVLENALSYGRTLMFLGDGVDVPVYRGAIAQYTGTSIASANNNMQRASSVGLAALDMVRSNAYGDYHTLRLMYLRKPQAEREREQRNG